MGQAMTQPALRPLLPADVPVLAAIFAASIEELAEDDYSEAQRAAWASRADDEEAFGKKLTGQLTLVATINGAPVGFASLKGGDHIDMLFVHPSVAGPKRPQDRIELPKLKDRFVELFQKPITENGYNKPVEELVVAVDARNPGDTRARVYLVLVRPGEALDPGSPECSDRSQASFARV